VALESDVVAVRVTEIADRDAAGWGHDFHHAALTVADLYADLVSFPKGWPEHPPTGIHRRGQRHHRL
jgi:hypothetical protein